MMSEGASAFAEYFQKINTLEVLHMARNQIEDDGFVNLFTSLEASAQSGSLREIDISDNMI